MANSPNGDWRSPSSNQGKSANRKTQAWQNVNNQGQQADRPRQSKLAILGVIGFLVSTIIFVMIFLLWPSNGSGLITIADNPNNTSDQLTNSYDPYGWMSAKRLVEWAKQNHRDDRKLPKVIDEEPQTLKELDTWVESIAKDKKVDPVVVYVGLHGGINEQGDPVLYSQGETVTVVSMLEKIQQRASNKQVVLVFDVQRKLPDNDRGELYLDFTKAMKERLSDQIEKQKNLAVIISAEDGQKAWNFPEYGMTNTAYHLAKSLVESAGQKTKRSFNAFELYQDLALKIPLWSKNNRISDQKPIILPDENSWKEGSARITGFNKKPFYRAVENKTQELSRLTPLANNQSKRFWQEADKLSDKIISPHTYTPLAWRRYRELLLRYELAVESGDADGEQRLATAIDLTKKEIDKGLDLNIESYAYINPLAVSLGINPQNSVKIDNVINSTSLSDARKLATQDVAKRPVELHLPVMMNYFARDLLKADEKSPFEVYWKELAILRKKAELASTSVVDPLSPSNERFPFSEFTWPTVRKQIVDADRLRRTAEDRFHSIEKVNDPIAVEMKNAVQSASKIYDQSIQTSTILQKGMAARNKALADLPYISRWMVESGGDIDLAIKALQKTNDLIQDLKPNNDPNLPLIYPNIEESTNQLSGLMKKLNDQIEFAVKDNFGPKTQNEIRKIQALLQLPNPIIREKDRSELTKLLNEITQKLSENIAEAKSDPAQTGNQLSNLEMAQRRLNVTLAMQGELWRDWVQKLKAVDPLPKKMALIEGSDLLNQLALLSSQIQKHKKIQAEADIIKNGEAEWYNAEIVSRLAYPLKNNEPTRTISQIKWRRYLEGQAHRIALDHWYDEKGKNYFTAEIARSMLTDAGEKSEFSSDDRVKAEELIKVLPLNMKRVEAEQKEILWTNEQNRRLTYLIDSYPTIPGLITAWVSSTNSILLDVAKKERSLYDLKNPLTIESQIENKLKQEDQKPREPYATIESVGYFRGQKPSLNTRFIINNEPDVVINHTQPEGNSVFGIRSDADPGSIAILIDYSGSMMEELPGSRKTKKDLVIETMQKLLAEIPSRTKIKIYLMNNNVNINDDNCFIIYNNENGVLNISTIIQQLNQSVPSGGTPLIKCMEKIVNKEKCNTLIALTDGIDNSFLSSVKEIENSVTDKNNIRSEAKTILDSDKRKDYINNVNRELTRRLDVKNISYQIISFGLSADEKTIAGEIFRPMETRFDTPAQFYYANDTDRLAEQLLMALQPKITITTWENKSKIPNNQALYLPEGGVPTNLLNAKPGQIWWWGNLGNGDYRFKHRETDYKIEFQKGRNLFLKLSEGKLQRDLYYREIKNNDGELKALRNDFHKKWYFALDHLSYEVLTSANYISATGILEDKSKVSDTPLSQVVPQFYWWEMTIQNSEEKEERFPGMVYVRPVYNLEAPAWHIAGKANNQLKKDFKQYPTTIRCFAQHEQLKPIYTQKLPQNARELTSGRIKIRISYEDMKLVDEPASLPEHAKMTQDLAKGKNRYLVVRVEDADGRILQANIPNDNFQVKEHRYYYEKPNGIAEGLRPKVANYTGIFGPFPNESNNEAWSLNLVDVTELMQRKDEDSKPVEIKTKPGDNRIQQNRLTPRSKPSN